MFHDRRKKVLCAAQRHLARRSRKHCRYLNNSDVNVVSDAAYACACNRPRSYAMQRIKDPPRAKRHTHVALGASGRGATPAKAPFLTPKLPLVQAVAQHASDDVIPLHDHAASKDAGKFLSPSWQQACSRLRSVDLSPG